MSEGLGGSKVAAFAINQALPGPWLATVPGSPFSLGLAQVLGSSPGKQYTLRVSGQSCGLLTISMCWVSMQRTRAIAEVAGYAPFATVSAPLSTGVVHPTGVLCMPLTEPALPWKAIKSTRLRRIDSGGQALRLLA